MAVVTTGWQIEGKLDWVCELSDQEVIRLTNEYTEEVICFDPRDVRDVIELLSSAADNLDVLVANNPYLESEEK